MSRSCVCPGCGLILTDLGLPVDERANASGECRALYWELSAETLARGDAEFRHQGAVDAYTAQHAGGPSRPISVAFALIGLSLTLERGWTGREAQLAHVALARERTVRPVFDRPDAPAAITIRDVLAEAAAEPRDQIMNEWMAAVWASWASAHDEIRRLCDDRLPALTSGGLRSSSSAARTGGEPS